MRLNIRASLSERWQRRIYEKPESAGGTLLAVEGVEAFLCTATSARGALTEETKSKYNYQRELCTDE